MIYAALYKNNELMGESSELTESEFKLLKNIYDGSKLELREVTEKFHKAILKSETYPKDERGKRILIVKHDVPVMKEIQFRVPKCWSNEWRHGNKRTNNGVYD